MMDFAEVLTHFHDKAEGQGIYSVEIRNMLNHETAIRYYLTAEEAISAAEQSWLEMDEALRDEREISVHKGTLEQQQAQVRFVVHQKLFKAYKKIYVAQDYARAYLSQRRAYYSAHGAADEEAALALAKADLAARFAIQSKVAYGMFAGYSYGPAEPERF